MRIYQLGQSLLEKFVPMDAQSNSELQLDAIKFYNEIKEDRLRIIKENQDAVDKNLRHQNDKDYVPIPLQALKLKHKILGYAEQWWLRYIFAILFIYLVPAISRFIAGSDGGDDDDDDDDELAAYMEFRKFKKGMK